MPENINQAVRLNVFQNVRTHNEVMRLWLAIEVGLHGIVVGDFER